MQGEQRRGLTYSIALHIFMVLCMVVGLPSFLSPDPLPQPLVVSVDIINISDVTNVKPNDAPLKDEEKEAPEKEQEKPSPPVKTEEEKTPPPPPPPKEEKPKEKTEPAPKKPEPKKEEEKQEKAKEDDLEAVLRAVKEQAQKEKKTEKPTKPNEEAGTRVKGENTNYDERQPLSMTEMDAIRSQIAKCWSMPAGAKNGHDLAVVLRVQLELDGTVLKVELASESRARYSADSFYRAAADSAMRAVRQCSPLKNLPPDKYGTWRDIEMKFDPKELLF